MINLGKLFIISGVVFIIIGAGFIFFYKMKVPFLGRLPGDIFIQRGNFSFYFPLTSCIILSIIFSLIIYLLFKK